ncbi:MAG: histidine phosphatase family protein, partial [Pseudomonadota bacterium]
CTTQRNLSVDGRRQAKRAGEIVRAAGIQIDFVWSSQWCRCLDTAHALELGEVIEETALNSFSAARWKATARTRHLKELLAALPPGRTAFLVTHNVNSEALTGVRPIPGEIQIVQTSETGEITLLGSVRIPAF